MPTPRWSRRSHLRPILPNSAPSYSDSPRTHGSRTPTADRETSGSPGRQNTRPVTLGHVRDRVLVGFAHDASNLLVLMPRLTHGSLFEEPVFHASIGSKVRGRVASAAHAPEMIFGRLCSVADAKHESMIGFCLGPRCTAHLLRGRARSRAAVTLTHVGGG